MGRISGTSMERRDPCSFRTESTPNPATLKFLPGQTVLDAGTADFPTPETAGKSPLAERLFKVQGVTGVFFGNDFGHRHQGRRNRVGSHEAGHPWRHHGAFPVGASRSCRATPWPRRAMPSMTGKIPRSSARSRNCSTPASAPRWPKDGGDITFHGFERGVVYLHMQGACAGCPSSTITLKMGIENLLRHYIPEVTEVRPVGI